jgi:hypothetical protein
VSRIIERALKEKLIKRDPVATSKKLSKYLPYWA